MKANIASDNVSGMEAQHRTLGRCAAVVCDALRDGCAFGELTEKLENLLTLTDGHFIDEEKLMRLYGFDGLESHRRTHERLWDRLTGLRGDILRGFGAEEKQALVSFLEGDFRAHVTEDMHAWESGEIAKSFAYQRLWKQESSQGRHEA